MRKAVLRNTENLYLSSNKAIKQGLVKYLEGEEAGEEEAAEEE